MDIVHKSLYMIVDNYSMRAAGGATDDVNQWCLFMHRESAPYRYRPVTWFERRHHELLT